MYLILPADSVTIFYILVTNQEVVMAVVSQPDNGLGMYAWRRLPFVQRMGLMQYII